MLAKSSIQKGKDFYKYRRWTPEEDKLLKKLYQEKTLEELGVIFDRDWNKICRRAIRLGLKKDLKLVGKKLSKKLRKLFKKGFLNQKGISNSHWSGGRVGDGFGYIKIYCPEHPNAIQNYLKEHRLVMENFLGRYLTKEEKIHHINGKKDDNRIENLYLCKNESEHKRLFHRESFLKIRFNGKQYVNDKN